MDENKNKEKIQPKLLRSPNYPAYALDKAIDIAKKLYEKYLMRPIPVPVAMDYLGFSIKSSSGLQVIAVLVSYGLITTEGFGKDKLIKLSDLAFKIIKSPHQAERENAIQSAAMKPPIFRSIMEKYNNEIPDEDILKYDLERELKFNPKSIPGFVDVFLKTISLAKISESDIITDESGQPEGQITADIGDSKMTNMEKSPATERQLGRFYASPSPSPSPSAYNEREIANYPIGRGLKARILIAGESPVTTDTIEKLIRLLDINKEDLHEIANDKEMPSEN